MPDTEDESELVDMLEHAGADRVNHHGSTLLAHLVGTARLLRTWDCPAHVWRAGLLHSFYSWLAEPTERSRAALASAIGVESETLVYLFARIKPEHLVDAVRDGADWMLQSTGESVRIPPETYSHLLWMDLANAEEMLNGGHLEAAQCAVLRTRCARVQQILDQIDDAGQAACPFGGGQQNAVVVPGHSCAQHVADTHDPVSAPPVLKVWKLHPDGVRLSPADATLGGRAPAAARRYCGPYIHANAAGFYLHSPIDVDLSFDPERLFPWEWNIHGQGYTDADVEVISSMTINHAHFTRDLIRRRPKLFLSGDNNEPKQTAQLWTGCIFETPPGWSLLVRSPINRGFAAPFRVQEAILESDWLRYDIWLNLEFVQFGVEARIRRDGDPIAHLLPIPRQSYGRWQVQERMMAPDDPEAQAVFDDWIEYNWEKFHARTDGAKEPRTYARRRKRLRDRVHDI